MKDRGKVEGHKAWVLPFSDFPATANQTSWRALYRDIPVAWKQYIQKPVLSRLLVFLVYREIEAWLLRLLQQRGRVRNRGRLKNTYQN